MAACGRMYLDEGEELAVGTAADNLLAFDAATSPAGNGTQGQVRAAGLQQLLSPHAAVGGPLAACVRCLRTLAAWPGKLCRLLCFCSPLLKGIGTLAANTRARADLLGGNQGSKLSTGVMNYNGRCG